MLTTPTATTSSEPAPTPTSTEPQAPAPTQTQVADWRASLDPDLVSDPSLGAIKDVNSLAKSYVHAQKMIGKNKITIPDEHGTEDDWKQVYHKLGLPETMDKYNVNFGEAQYDEEFKKGYLEAAYKNGVLPKQAEAMFNYWNTQVEQANSTYETTAQKSREEQINSLKQEWGNGFEKKVEIARTALRQFADEATIEYIEKSGLGNDTNLVKLFAKIGESLNEDSFKSDVVKHLGMTKEEAKSKIDTMMGDFTHPYYNIDHPNHKAAVADMQKYYEVLES